MINFKEHQILFGKLYSHRRQAVFVDISKLENEKSIEYKFFLKNKNISIDSVLYTLKTPYESDDDFSPSKIKENLRELVSIFKGKYPKIINYSGLCISKNYNDIVVNFCFFSLEQCKELEITNVDITDKGWLKVSVDWPIFTVVHFDVPYAKALLENKYIQDTIFESLSNRVNKLKKQIASAHNELDAIYSFLDDNYKLLIESE